MNKLYPLLNIKKAIAAIDSGAVEPVIEINDLTFYLDTRLTTRGVLLYTVFNATGEPIETLDVRYGSYHTLLQLLTSPLSRTKYSKLIHTELPITPDVLPITQILAGYKENYGQRN